MMALSCASLFLLSAWFGMFGSSYYYYYYYYYYYESFLSAMRVLLDPMTH